LTTKKKRGAPFKRPEKRKKQLATRIDPEIRAWLQTQKNQARTIENALFFYRAFLEKAILKKRNKNGNLQLPAESKPRKNKAKMLRKRLREKSNT